jgi:sigma-70-like protein
MSTEVGSDRRGSMRRVGDSATIQRRKSMRGGLRFPTSPARQRAARTIGPRLEAIAYRLLGSTGEAEDVVQETFLRWHAADVDRIEVPEAWLTKVLTNLCLNGLVQHVTADDRAVPAVLTGRLAAVYKELVCKGAA